MVLIGIDVGGTNTDAVLMDGPMVIATHKSATTPDIGSGILAAMRSVIGQGGRPSSDVRAVMIGTTHFTNAFVERRNLLPIAAVRIAAPATTAIPPLLAWPDDLRAAVGDCHFIVRGGHNIDGSSISEVDENEIRSVAAKIRHRGIRAVALNAVFSPLNPGMEEQVASILSSELPDLFITLGSDIGQLGLLERENASAINASLRELAQHVVRSFSHSMTEAGIDAPLYVSQNDGTLMSAEKAEEFPILTFTSGPTNSMRGAGLLSGEKDAIVVDIGGTTTDVGALRQGFPREASSEVEIASVKTNFRMPDVVSVGLGGGSVVRESADGISIGPDSVGFELITRALVFGGDTLTTTDIAVAAGYADIGDRSRVANLDRDLVESVVAQIHQIVEDTIDRAKTSAGDVPVVLVGGGAVLIDGDLRGASRTIRPEHAGVANAIGAAMAQISGEVDHVVSLADRDAALEQCRADATTRAVAGGADRATINVVDQEEIPLTYLPGVAMARIRIRVVGDLVGDNKDSIPLTQEHGVAR